jgi:hypothetical protein
VTGLCRQFLRRRRAYIELYGRRITPGSRALSAAESDWIDRQERDRTQSITTLSLWRAVAHSRVTRSSYLCAVRFDELCEQLASQQDKPKRRLSALFSRTPSRDRPLP